MKGKSVSKILVDNILYICLLIMIIVIAVISPSFLSGRVLSDVLIQSAPKICWPWACWWSLWQAVWI